MTESAKSENAAMRQETDLLGTLSVPETAYWGIHTQRAIQNFPLSGIQVNPSLIKAIALVKKACAKTNLQLNYLEAPIADAIIQACDDIMQDRLDMSHFPVDALQGGAGTSTNMNLNEVIANRALEIRGLVKGNYDTIHPIEHVNLHQSTNDVYPTALKIATIWACRSLSEVLARLQGILQQQETAFQDVLKMGRTELQDAVPITLGREFGAFAEAIARDRWRTFKCEERLRLMNMGGTALGTGLTAPRNYINQVVQTLQQFTGIGLSRSENLMDATANTDCFVEVSGMLKACAANLSKLANDLRLLQAFGEIHLPAWQAGSSIMPGKVNPVALEACIQVSMKVMANDTLVSNCVSRSSLQINEFLPLLAHALLESFQLLENAVQMMIRLIPDITADRAVCLRAVQNSPTLITAFLPQIGYEKATELLKDFHVNAQGRLLQAYLEDVLGKEHVQEILSQTNLTRLGTIAPERKDG